ncbi:hypothetical protein LJC59_01225 [Desulfovibrio sp. OttesenSCG-928-A18]|nr:hypothetical protein [Desulfovibrio sp. OttesenSCG-928-A18]
MLTNLLRITASLAVDVVSLGLTAAGRGELMTETTLRQISQEKRLKALLQSRAQKQNREGGSGK